MGKRDVPTLAIKEAYAIGVFKSFYLLADTRLGKKKLSCSPGKAASEGNLLKGTELIYFHKKELICFHKKTLWELEPHIICILPQRGELLNDVHLLYYGTSSVFVSEPGGTQEHSRSRKESLREVFRYGLKALNKFCLYNQAQLHGSAAFKAWLENLT